MSNRHWTWALGASATLAGAAAAVLLTGPSPARSDEEEYEIHTPPDDHASLQAALANWDDEDAREDALAAYLGDESGAAMLAPYEDPNYVDNN